MESEVMVKVEHGFNQNGGMVHGGRGLWTVGGGRAAIVLIYSALCDPLFSHQKTKPMEEGSQNTHSLLPKHFLRSVRLRRRWFHGSITSLKGLESILPLCDAALPYPLTFVGLTNSRVVVCAYIVSVRVRTLYDLLPLPTDVYSYSVIHTYVLYSRVRERANVQGSMTTALYVSDTTSDMSTLLLPSKSHPHPPHVFSLTCQCHFPR
ncbi:hypothetical protein J6590_033121 [Homalodisca vitripennis]|nr:hypothetical protein J6590_033121 [Homalodisca vitripennis]